MHGPDPDPDRRERAASSGPGNSSLTKPSPNARTPRAASRECGIATGQLDAVFSVYFVQLVFATSSDAALLLAARGVRAFGDGFVSVLLPLHLTTLGFSAVRIGVLTTATLLGSAALTLLVGQFAGRWKRADLLIRASAIMIATGLGFALLDGFWPLMLVAFVGTLNPSSGTSVSSSRPSNRFSRKRRQTPAAPRCSPAIR